MTDSTSYNIDAEAWRRALLAIKRRILDAQPVEALRQLDELLDALVTID
jgi:hypothetical protein